MENAIIHFNQIPSANLSKVLILGEMKELGIETDTEHQKIVDLAEKLPFDLILLVGKAYKNLKKTKAKHFDNNELLIEYLKSNKIASSYVLIKGSRGAKLEEVYQAVFKE
jgi:UDP-N-acetylmuramoyl-tripeptide--D-alanyl-D-alanine ligase